MIYKQYTSKNLFEKYIPKNGEIVQLSVQSRPNTFLKITTNNNSNYFKIGELGILEWDSISINKHLTDDKNFNIKIEVVNHNEDNNLDTIAEGAIVDILYNNSKEEDLNLESL